MAQVNKQRLLILAKHLNNHVEPYEFHLGVWKRVDEVCGTVACACGHAANIPAFAEAGLRLEPGTFGHYTLMFGGHSAWVAAAKFFDLQYNDMYRLFCGGYYEGIPTPQDVAARIEEFVKQQETS
jgi:hypothetical protein